MYDPDLVYGANRYDERSYRLRVYLLLHDLTAIEFATLAVIACEPVTESELLLGYERCSIGEGDVFEIGGCDLGLSISSITEEDARTALARLTSIGFIRPMHASDLSSIVMLRLVADRMKSIVASEVERGADSGVCLILTDLGQKHWDHVVSRIFTPDAGADIQYGGRANFAVSLSPPCLVGFGCPVYGNDFFQCDLFRADSLCTVNVVYDVNSEYWWRNEFITYVTECRSMLAERAGCGGGDRPSA